jgi:hypothetical protein
MPMMPQALLQDKPELWEPLLELVAQVETAARAGTAVHELEHGLFRGVLALGHQLLGYFFRLLGDGDQGERLTLADGQEFNRLEARSMKRYQSVFGTFELIRRVYGSRAGQRIECVPLDTRLQLPASDCSYLLQDWAQALAVEMPYQPVSALLEKLLQVRIPVSALERMNSTVATSVVPYGDAHRPEPTPEGEFLVVSADGKGVPIRKPAECPPIQTHDSTRGPKPERKKMAILGAVYAGIAYERTPEQVWQALFAEPCPGDGAANDACFMPRPRPVNKAVRASLTVPAADGGEIPARQTLFAWLEEQVQHRDPTQHQPLVVLMDGQHCLWSDAAEVFAARPRVEILDLLHATAKLWDVVHALHPSGGERDAMKLYTLLLLRGQVEDLCVWFRHHAASTALSASDRARIEQVCGYFETHRTRMHYDHYLAAGYPIASGVIEGACRHVVKDRLERSGMHWTIAGAQAMLHLRCVAINDQWQDFMRFRIQQETLRLYPHATLFETIEWPLQRAA